MYEYKKRPSKTKKVFLIFILMAVVSILSIFIYNMYINIDVYSKGENEKSSSGIRLAQDIKEEEKNNKENDITEILEKDIKSVVGISKIKNNGNSIFLNNSTQELGLGTGIIVTDKRIYSYKLACRRE